MSEEFKSFHEITRINSPVTITEKIHGTNAQILIEDEISVDPVTSQITSKTVAKAGSRTRWITPDDDNYGFARWVQENEQELIRCLGIGRHFGEWYGSGINSGYNLKNSERRFALFHQGFAGKELPAGVEVVPVLYRGGWTPEAINQVMVELKAMGSKAQPGFMSPEGIVIRFERNGATFKQVFEAEETGWAGKPKEKIKSPSSEMIDQEKVNALLQPIRLEKLLSRDERYVTGYPASLPQIVKDYVADMEKEQQFNGVDDNVVKAAKRFTFQWVKEIMKEKGLSS